MRELKARSPTLDRLLKFVLDGVPPPTDDFEGELAVWLNASSRFAAFVDAHRDKIRKKLRVAADPESRGDVRAELETASLLLADRRIDLAFEAYGTGRRGPDFTVTFRASHRFNLEVTRPRTRDDRVDPKSAIANALLAKLRQLPVDSPNALFIATGLARSDDEVAGAVRALRLRADQGDERNIEGRGLSTPEFQRLYRRLAVVFVASATGQGVHAWTNPEAPRRLPHGATAACLACLGALRAKPEASVET